MKTTCYLKNYLFLLTHVQFLRWVTTHPWTEAFWPSVVHKQDCSAICYFVKHYMVSGTFYRRVVGEKNWWKITVVFFCLHFTQRTNSCTPVKRDNMEVHARTYHVNKQEFSQKTEKNVGVHKYTFFLEDIWHGTGRKSSGVRSGTLK